MSLVAKVILFFYVSFTQITEQPTFITEGVNYHSEYIPSVYGFTVILRIDIPLLYIKHKIKVCRLQRTAFYLILYLNFDSFHIFSVSCTSSLYLAGHVASTDEGLSSLITLTFPQTLLPMIPSLYLLQFASFIFSIIMVLLLCTSRLQQNHSNRRYETARLTKLKQTPVPKKMPLPL